MARPRKGFEKKVESLEQFLKFTVKAKSGCLLWIGTIVPQGYGGVWSGGKSWLTHRLSWILHGREIPDGLSVLHHCDVRPCVNPDHLYVGTQTDNMRDVRERNRYARGDKHGSKTHPETVARGETLSKKLTTADVVSIKRRLAAGDIQRAIAVDFGISRSMVGLINTGDTWAHVQTA